jgi:hypothetical protein
VTEIGEEAPLAVIAVPPPTGVAVTVYEVIADPPLLAGAVNAIDVLPEVVEVGVTPVGAPGFVAGVTEEDDVEEFDVPAPLLAVTAKV